MPSKASSQPSNHPGSQTRLSSWTVKEKKERKKERKKEKSSIKVVRKVLISSIFFSQFPWDKIACFSIQKSFSLTRERKHFCKVVTRKKKKIEASLVLKISGHAMFIFFVTYTRVWLNAHALEKKLINSRSKKENGFFNPIFNDASSSKLRHCFCSLELNFLILLKKKIRICWQKKEKKTLCELNFLFSFFSFFFFFFLLSFSSSFFSLSLSFFSSVFFFLYINNSGSILFHHFTWAGVDRKWFSVSFNFNQNSISQIEFAAAAKTAS